MAFCLLVIELYNIYLKSATGVYFLGKVKVVLKATNLNVTFLYKVFLIVVFCILFSSNKILINLMLFFIQGSGSTSMTKIQQTVATYFRFSLMDLLAKMVAGSPHFVRSVTKWGSFVSSKYVRWQKGKVMYCLFFQNKRKHRHCNFFKYCLSRILLKMYCKIIRIC